ncbi:YfhO family protein [Nonlabens ponticola]|uniref:YfhO family protein n=1 Tax=Nonlabens ponticola TaxID=2496866 RepID=A0A3S9MYK2_9FLAO|nr:YfhO family protein [Nonlabens ponticola]AZQ44238.1 hypothetical protein EJ995_08315 [Nonlabens ponticola]
MSFDFKKIAPHLVVFVIFIIAALAYFHPVLSNKKLYQSDIVQYKGNARQLIENRAETGEEIYWTNAVFGGMPTYQLGARYPYDFIDALDRGLRFMPRPADYLFLYFISFYVLMLVLRVDWQLGLIGAFAFGFSTYLVIILGVGHNAKAHAIAYFPLVLSGIILVFQKRYVIGGLLTALAVALELQANHPQMTYYLFIATVILGIAYLIDAVRRQQLPHYFKSVAIMAVAALIGLGTNAANLLATQQYSQESTRGPSDLTISAQGESVQPTDGLAYDYITQYSYGLTESFNLIIPRFAGGGSGARPDEDSNTVEFLEKLGLPKASAMDFVQNQVPLYWGDQIIVEAPAYIGITVFFLAVIALFLIKGRLKWWTLGTAILALLLSYGKNLDFLTRFFVDYVPLYDKFRAVTSIQVLIELVIPILAVVGLYQLFNKNNKLEEKGKALLYAAIGVGGLLAVFAAFGNQLFDFAGAYDAAYLQQEQLGSGFVDALRQDRFEVMRADSLRGLFYIGVISLALWLYFKSKLQENAVLIIVGIFILVDLVSFDLNYVNEDDYVSASQYDNAFQRTPIDEQVLQDDGYFRVYDQLMNPFNSARAPYFHNALGGYHGAKPRRIQEIADFYLFDPQLGMRSGLNEQNQQILSMFNVKYLIDVDEEGLQLVENRENLGAAWFVKELQVVNNADEEMLALANLDGKKRAIMQQSELEKISLSNISVDSTAQIRLISHSPEQMVYQSTNSSDALAVFSEAYYPHGWIATIDGLEVPIARANYALRALKVPAGSHKIEFTFEPDVVETGTAIMLTSNVLLILLLLGGTFYLVRKKN